MGKSDIKRRRGRPWGAQNKASDKLRSKFDVQTLRIGEDPKGELIKENSDAIPNEAYQTLAVLGHYKMWRDLGFNHRASVELAGLAPDIVDHYAITEKMASADARQFAAAWGKGFIDGSLTAPPLGLIKQHNPVGLSRTRVEEILDAERREKISLFGFSLSQGNDVTTALRQFCIAGYFGFGHDQHRALLAALRYLKKQGVQQVKGLNILAGDAAGLNPEQKL